VTPILLYVVSGYAVPMEQELDDVYLAILDRCKAHVVAAVNRGFSPEAAEDMAVALHAVLLANTIND